jgi:hypothetical protein
MILKTFKASLTYAAAASAFVLAIAGITFPPSVFT